MPSTRTLLTACPIVVVFTLFVFGALTYIAVKRGDEAERSLGRGLTHRLIPNHDSEDELDPDNTPPSSAVEMDNYFMAPPIVEEDQMQYPPRPQWME